jgi:hypothetical protein
VKTFWGLSGIHKPEPKEISSDSGEFCQVGNWIFWCRSWGMGLQFGYKWLIMPMNYKQNSGDLKMSGSEVYMECSYLPFPVLCACKLFSVPKWQWKLKLRRRSRWTLESRDGNTKSWLFHTHQSQDPLATACNSYGRHGKGHQFLWVTSFPQCNRWTSTIDKTSVLLPTLFRQYQKAQSP